MPGGLGSDLLVPRWVRSLESLSGSIISIIASMFCSSEYKTEEEGEKGNTHLLKSVECAFDQRYKEK